MKYGFLVQKGGFWIGVHYSPFHRRFCINLLPFLTFWFCLEGGHPPYQVQQLTPIHELKAAWGRGETIERKLGNQEWVQCSSEFALDLSLIDNPFVQYRVVGK